MASSLKKLILIALFFGISTSYAQFNHAATFSKNLIVRDPTQETYPYQISVDSGIITDNGDGTIFLTGIGSVAEKDLLSLHLDQVSPQTLVSGVPLMTTSVDIDGSIYQLVNKEYVDTALLGLELTEFFSTVNSVVADGLGGYYKIMDNSTQAAGTNTKTGLGAGAAQFLWGYITPVGSPNLTTLYAGVYNVRGNLYKGNPKTVYVYKELYSRTTGGVETLLGTSDLTAALTTSTVPYNVAMYIPSNVTLDPTDRLVLKVYANITGGAGNTSVSSNIGGTTSSGITIQAPAIDVAALSTAISFSVIAGEELKKGQAVYISGASSGLPQVMKGDNTSTTKCRVVGLVTEDLANGAIGKVRRTGILINVDTQATNAYVNPNAETWLAGDLLFATTGGGLTKTRPTSGRSVKAGYSLLGSSATDTLLVYPFENPVWHTAAAGEDNVLRVGDDIGVNKISFRNYSNVTMGSITSTGYLGIGTITASGIISGVGSGLTSIPSDGTWTTHNSYPSACSAGTYVSAIGDTLTCSTPAGGTGGTGIGTITETLPLIRAWAITPTNWQVTIGTVDISDNTNLTAGDDITLTGDDLDVDSTVTRDAEWDTIGEINTATTDADIIATNSSWTGGDLGGTGLAATVSNDSHDHSAAGSTVTIAVADITDDNAGTDITADLEEEAHCSEHDSTDVDCSGETITVVDDSHNHTSTTISGLDISADTNLTAGDALTLTDDDLDFDGGASPAGELGGTWASPTIDDSLAVSTWSLTTPTLLGNVGIGTVISNSTPIFLNATQVSIGTTAPVVARQLYVAGNTHINPTGGATGGLFINASGVGIGITAPTSNLHVNGTANIVTSLAIPQGSAPTVSAAGHIGVDTTDDQLKYYGGAERVIPYTDEKCFTVFSPATADDDIPIWSPVDAIAITSMYCRTQGGTSAAITISDGTNACEAITCDADGQADDGSVANGTFTANERMEYDTGTVTGTVTAVNYCIRYTTTAQ